MVLELGNLDSTVLFFGGPYSNLAATQAVLNQAQQLNIDRQHIICTGDVVAYCAEAQQTCETIIDAGIHVVMGNVEESLATQSDDCGCGFSAEMVCSTLSKKWYDYANGQISTDTRQWMSQLPAAITFTMSGLRLRVIHGGAKQINRFIFASTSRQIKQQELDHSGADIIVGGHCGIPFGQKTGSRGWLNAGVVGLPANEGITSTWYMLLTPGSNGITASWNRLDYDFETTYQSMKAAGLDDYAEAIIHGRWPSMDVLPDEEKSQQGKRLELPELFLEAQNSAN